MSQDDRAVRSYQLEVWWDGHAIPEISAVSPLRTSSEVITYREGNGAIHKLPGRMDTATVSFRRSVGADLAFDTWAKSPYLRKDVELRFTDSGDGLSVTYLLHECWVCEYDVSPHVDTGELQESVTLAVNGWQRVTPSAADLAQRWARQRGTNVRRVRLADLLTGRSEETIRQLDALISEVESAGVVLLLDEADDVFASRTEVDDAHDRYQPTELDAVLDRLARFHGQVVVAPPARRDLSEGRRG